MDHSELLRHSKKWDRTGVMVSSLCLVHCLLLPLLVTLLPALELLFENLIFENIILCAAIIVAFFSFSTSFKKHRKYGPMIIGALGSLSLLYSLLGHSGPINHNISNNLALNPPVLIGGLLFMTGHLWNIYACHCFCDSSCNHTEHKHS